MPPLANTTTATDLIVPQVWGDFLAAKIPFAIKLRPLVTVDTTLQGQPGDTVTYAQWDYIGDAVDLPELADVELTKLGATSAEAKIKKSAKGIAFSDESILNAAGNPSEEGTRQLVQAHAQKVDADIHAQAVALAGKTADAAFTVDALVANMPQFGEETEPENFAALVVSPEDYYGQIIGDKRYASASEAGQPSTMVTGRLGSILGVPVVVSARAAAGALLVERGSLGLLLKRDVLIEKDRDIVNFSSIVTSSMHYTATVPRPSGVMKFPAAAAPVG